MYDGELPVEQGSKAVKPSVDVVGSTVANLTEPVAESKAELVQIEQWQGSEASQNTQVRRDCHVPLDLARCTICPLASSAALWPVPAALATPSFQLWSLPLRCRLVSTVCSNQNNAVARLPLDADFVGSIAIHVVDAMDDSWWLLGLRQAR